MEFHKIISEAMKHMERERDRMDEAINALAAVVGRKRKSGGRREMSEEARDKIRTAMVQRWKNRKKGKGTAPVSSSGHKIYPSTVALMAQKQGTGEIAEKLGISPADVRALLKKAAANKNKPKGKKEPKAKPAEA